MLGSFPSVLILRVFLTVPGCAHGIFSACPIPRAVIGSACGICACGTQTASLRPIPTPTGKQSRLGRRKTWLVLPASVHLPNPFAHSFEAPKKATPAHTNVPFSCQSCSPLRLPASNTPPHPPRHLRDSRRLTRYLVRARIASPGGRLTSAPHARVLTRAEI